MLVVTIRSLKGLEDRWQILDLGALNTVLQKVVAEQISAQNLWEQANENKDIGGLPQILEDSAIKTLRGQRAVLMAEYQTKCRRLSQHIPICSGLRRRLIRSLQK